MGFYVSTCTQVFFLPPGHKLFIEQTGLCNGAPPKSFVSHYRHDNVDCSLSLSDCPSFCVLNRRLCPLPKPLKRAKIAEQHPIRSSCLYHELRNKNRRGCGRENKPRFGGFHTAYRQMYVFPCPSSFSPLLLLLLPPALPRMTHSNFTSPAKDGMVYHSNYLLFLSRALYSLLGRHVIVQLDSFRFKASARLGHDVMVDVTRTSDKPR